MMMPSPKGSVRCAQLFMRIAGCAPAQRQGSALHPCSIPSTLWRGSSGCSKAVIGRAEASCKFHFRRSRARSGGAAEIFGGEFVGQPAAARVPPRNFFGHSGEIVQAAYMPALQAWWRGGAIRTVPWDWLGVGGLLFRQPLVFPIGRRVLSVALLADPAGDRTAEHPVAGRKV